MKLTYCIFALAAACGACASSSQEATTAAAPRQEAGPVIVRMVSRDSTIVARAGTHGPVYSLESAKGEQIIPSMTLPQLQAQHPDLARHVKTMQADARVIYAGME